MVNSNSFKYKLLKLIYIHIEWMIATLLTAYINILEAVVSLMTTSAQSIFQAVKPTITIPLGENLMEQVWTNSEALNNTVDCYQGRIVHLLQKLEDKLKSEMTMKEIVLKAD